MKEVKLTDMGVAPRGLGVSKEDERGAALAERARRGDYDNGTYLVLLQSQID